MKRLLVVGAGGLGREAMDVARILESGAGWRIAGFLDSRKDVLEGKSAGYPLVGSPDTYQPGDDELFVCAVGDPSARRSYIEALERRGAAFAQLLHPESDISPSARIGRGVVALKYARVGPDARVGEFTCIGYASGVAHDVILGRFCQISGHCSVNGRARLEDEVSLGAHAVVLPDVVVGRGATVGAGSVAVRNVPPGCTVFGMPATVLSATRGKG